MLQPKQNIARIAAGAHGGLDYAELEKLGISPESILDFSVSINPFGPPPGISEVLCNARIDTYPDSEANELVQCLAKKLKVSPANLIIGNGSTEIIRLITTAYFNSGDSVLIPQPTYSDYEIACQLVGAKVLKQSTLREPDFRLNVAETQKIMRETRPRGVFLCNPNNPTGQYLSKGEVGQIIATAKDGLVVLDEAYIAFTENAWSSLDLLDAGNLIIVRSMTKDYALAGLRIGYAIAAEPIISVLKLVRPPWNVSSLAQKAGVAALSADNYIRDCGRKIKEAKGFLVKELQSLDLAVVPSQTNFFLVKVGRATELKQALLKKGILVRDCTSFGLPECIRIAPRTMEECRKLVKAIKSVKESLN